MKIPEHAGTETGYQVFTEKPRIQAKKLSRSTLLAILRGIKIIAYAQIRVYVILNSNKQWISIVSESFRLRFNKNNNKKMTRNHKDAGGQTSKPSGARCKLLKDERPPFHRQTPVNESGSWSRNRQETLIFTPTECHSWNTWANPKKTTSITQRVPYREGNEVAGILTTSLNCAGR